VAHLFALYGLYKELAFGAACEPASEE
jgi:hypothetical protein